PANVGNTFRRLRNSRQDFEQRAFARAVVTDDAQQLALLQLERDVAQRPECLGVAVVEKDWLHRPVPQHRIWRGDQRAARLAYVAVVRKLADAIALSQVFNSNRDIAHWLSLCGLRNIGKCPLRSAIVEGPTE